MRQPFERLVSAYNAKMTNYVSDQSDFYAKVSRDISNKVRSLRENEAERSMVRDGFATFEDFVNYLLITPQKDMHWREYETICQPCLHDYDMILKFETFNDDFRYLKRYLNVSEYHSPAFFPPRTPRTDKHLTQSFMTSLSPMLRKRLYQMYQHDFEMFGYEKPWYV